MSNHSLPARRIDPPFSHKGVASITHEQNIIFAGHLVSSRPMKRKGKIFRMIKTFIEHFGVAPVSLG